jgi:hypothetical protein
MVKIEVNIALSNLQNKINFFENSIKELKIKQKKEVKKNEL